MSVVNKTMLGQNVELTNRTRLKFLMFSPFAERTIGNILLFLRRRAPTHPNGYSLTIPQCGILCQAVSLFFFCSGMFNYKGGPSRDMNYLWDVLSRSTLLLLLKYK
jgi:hypothetical protein